MRLKDVMDVCHSDSRKAGWYDTHYSMLESAAPDDRQRILALLISQKIALIHSEASEALEAFRKDTISAHLPGVSGFEEELSDVVIRVLDLCGFMGFDVEKTTLAKLEYNRNRADHKAEARSAPGGKKF